MQVRILPGVLFEQTKTEVGNDLGFFMRTPLFLSDPLIDPLIRTFCKEGASDEIADIVFCFVLPQFNSPVQPSRTARQVATPTVGCCLPTTANRGATV